MGIGNGNRTLMRSPRLMAPGKKSIGSGGGFVSSATENSDVDEDEEDGEHGAEEDKALAESAR